MFTEIRTYPLEVRDIDTKGIFVGHVSVFGVEDSFKTIFDDGSFSRTINARNGAFPLAKNHDWMSPFGMARGVVEDETGLLIQEGRINMKSSIGQEVYIGLPHPDDPASGYYSDMSHTFKTIRSKRDERGIEHKVEVQLFELSVVTRNFGSNPEAHIEQVRSATDTLRRLNTALKTGNEERFIEEVGRLRELLNEIDLPKGDDIERTSTLVEAEGPSIDTLKLHDSLVYLNRVINKVAKG